jgi:hypothetical protein
MNRKGCGRKRTVSIYYNYFLSRLVSSYLRRKRKQKSVRVCCLQLWSTLIFKGKKLISTIIHDPHEILQLRVEIPPGFWAYCQLGSWATRASCTYSTHISHSCLHLVSHTSQTKTQPFAIKPIISEPKLTNYKFKVEINNSKLKPVNNKIGKKLSPSSIGRYFRNMERRPKVTIENWGENNDCSYDKITKTTYSRDRKPYARLHFNALGKMIRCLYKL